MTSVRDYINWSLFSILFSVSLLFQHLLKVCFNIFSNLHIGFDKWTILDSISAFLNLVAVILIEKINPSVFLLERKKELVDYFMLVVLVVSWLRFFSYFLVV